MLNLVTIMGSLTKDPEVKTTKNDVKYCQFTVAVERDQKGQTDFVPCAAWRQTAEFLGKYFTKGQMICLTGKLYNSPYETSDGKKRDSWAIAVSQVFFCGSKAETNEIKPVSVQWEDLGDSEDGLPF